MSQNVLNYATNYTKIPKNQKFSRPLARGRTPHRGEKERATLASSPHKPRKTLHGASNLALCGGASVTRVRWQGGFA